jgi:predicted RNA-binding protein YlxR (DUF448 family)
MNTFFHPIPTDLGVWLLCAITTAAYLFGIFYLSEKRNGRKLSSEIKMLKNQNLEKQALLTRERGNVAELARLYRQQEEAMSELKSTYGDIKAEASQIQAKYDKIVASKVRKRDGRGKFIKSVKETPGDATTA